MKLNSSYRSQIDALKREWEHLPAQHGLRFFSLENEFLLVTVTNYGLRIIHLFTENKNGEPVDIIVGPETPQDFFASNNPYYGAIVGRFANRIDHGQFELNGTTYQLNCNNGSHHLHGGPNGLQNQLWDCIYESKEKLVFSHTSHHLTEQYPGTVTFEVSLELVQRSLKLNYKATTDTTTILNLTHHPFFNLDGSGSTNFDSHELQLYANNYLPVRSDMIPEGFFADVTGTPFDFTLPANISERLHLNHEQLQRGNGFDHCFVRNHYKTEDSGFVASVISHQSGIAMRICTSQPGVQLYTGNFMDGSNKMKAGSVDMFRSAFCLETQHFPDSPNQPQFPSVVLKPEQEYKSSTIFEFSINP